MRASLVNIFFKKRASLDASLTPKESISKLTINFYKRLKSSLQIWLNSPDSKGPVPYCYKYKNIIHEALDLRKFSRKNPQKTREQLAEHFQITRNKVYILRRLLRNLPPEFIKSFQNCEDKKTLRSLGQEKLLKIAKLDSITKRRDKIRQLLQNSTLS